MHTQGKKQLERDTTVNAPAGVVYRLFMDNAELANWAPAVDAVIGQHGGDGTGLGATRTCAVTLHGKKGTMVERCVEAVPDTRAAFLVVGDSFGFSKMLTGYGFTARFTLAAADQTTVRIETYYTPANPAAAVLNRLACGVSSAPLLTSSSGGCARSLSSAIPSPDPEPATLTPAWPRPGPPRPGHPGPGGLRAPGWGRPAGVW